MSINPLRPLDKLYSILKKEKMGKNDKEKKKRNKTEQERDRERKIDIKV